MPGKTWLRRWVPLLGGVVAAQSLVQGINALSGILLVWFLPRDTSYAWFTVASSMMLLATLLTDAGMMSATNTLGGPVWQEREKFSRVIQAVLRHQRGLVALAVFIVVPWMLVLLQRLHGPLWATSLAAVAVMLSAWQTSSAQIFSSVNRLHSMLRPQLIAETTTAVIRLLLTVGCLVAAWLCSGNTDIESFVGRVPPGPIFAAVLLAAALPSIYFHFSVKRSALKVLAPVTGPAHEYDADIRRIIRQTSGFTIYYCLQGQMSIWLISWFGVSAQVADIGALGRLGMLFAVASGPLVQIVIPSFARSTDRHQLRRLVFRVCGSYALFAASILLLVTFMPGPVLWLLGPQYGHLGSALPLVVLGLTSAAYSGIIWGLVLARGWVKTSALIIPVGLAAQLAGVFIFDFTSVTGVLEFNLFTSVPAVLLACIIARTGFSRWKEVSTDPT